MIDDPWMPTPNLRWRLGILQQEWSRRVWRWVERTKQGCTRYESEWRDVPQAAAEELSQTVLAESTK